VPSPQADKPTASAASTWRQTILLMHEILGLMTGSAVTAPSRQS